MHRRSVCGLASASFKTDSRRYASNSAVSVPKPRRPNPKVLRMTEGEVDKVKRSANGLVAAVAKKHDAAGWGHAKQPEGETKRLVQDVKAARNPAKFESLDKQNFDASLEELSLGMGEGSAIPELKDKLPPGTLVEMRRNGVANHGVILRHFLINGTWTVCSLIASGEVWPHNVGDVMFAIPGFIPVDLIERCGLEVAAQDEHEIGARVHVLKLVRNLRMSQERRLTELYHPMKALYDKFKADDPNEWSYCTTKQAVQYVDPQGRDTSPVTHLAAHAYLFSKAKYFVSETTDFLSRQIFWLRPQRDVEEIELMERMVIHKDPVLDSFVEKANKLIAAARARADKSWQGPMSFDKSQIVCFTPQEMKVVHYLQHSITSMRKTQADPYIFAQSAILRRVDEYHDLEINNVVVQRFLIEIGVLPSWQDYITREPIGWMESHISSIQFQIQDDLPTKSSQSAPRASSPQPLGPDDLYSYDVVDSLRHDFGDMPVYVIDDMTAEELDDGVSIETIPSEPGNIWLHVHIADPTAVIPPTHRIIRRAFTQLETRYLVDRSIPLLPQENGLKSMSLGSSDNGEECVMTFSAKVDQEGNVVDYKVRPGIARNIKILRYDAVDAAMNMAATPPSFPFGSASRPSLDLSRFDGTVLRDMSLLHDVARKLVYQRVKNGAIYVDRFIPTITLKPTPLPDIPPMTSRPYVWSGFPELEFRISSSRASEVGARMLVAESMRTAGRVASLFFRDRGIPALRRTSSAPMATDIDMIMSSRGQDGFVDQNLSFAAGLSFPAGREVLTPDGHPMLGISDGAGYSRVTSPLRRFADMVAHWQIKHALLNPGNPKARMFSESWLEAFAQDVTLRQRRIKRAAATQQSYWAHMFIERWRHERAKGWREGPDPLDSLVAVSTTTALRNSKKSYYQQAVTIPALGMNADLIDLKHEEADVPAGQEIDVKIAEVRLGLRPHLTVRKK